MRLEKKFIVEFAEDETIEDLIEILDRDEFAEPIVGSLGCEDCEDCDVFVCPTCDNEGLYETQAFCDDCGQRLDWDFLEDHLAKDIYEEIKKITDILLSEVSTEEIQKIMKNFK